MFRLREKGFSTVEMMVGIVFLALMGLFSWNILEKQKRIILTSTQSIEIVNYLYEFRKILSDPASCTRTLRGLRTDTSSGVIQSLIEVSSGRDGIAKERVKFLTLAHNGIRNKEIDLGIESYSLSKLGIFNNRFDNGTYLVIDFNTGLVGNRELREIKIYLEEEKGVIKKCALGEFPLQENIFQSSQGHQIYMDGPVSVGHKQWNERLDINGMIQLIGEELECSDEKMGMIWFSSKEKKLFICDGGALARPIPFAMGVSNEK